MSEGYIYILSNETMPNVLKIGRSINGGKKRAVELYTTGVPTKFNLEFEVLVDDAPYVEQAVHERLAEHRVNSGREFFCVFLDDAIEAVVSEYMSGLDRTVCYAEERVSLDHLNEKANEIDAHPFILGAALRFIDAPALNSALQKHEEWMELKRKDSTVVPFSDEGQ